MAVLLIIQNCLYVATLISGFLVAVPVALVKGQFKGTCPLYGDVSERTALVGSLVKKLFLVTPGSSTNCDYIVNSTAVFSICGAFILLCLHVAALVDIQKNPATTGCFGSCVTSAPWRIGMLVFHAIASFIALVAACIVTDGLRRFCGVITSLRSFSHCSQLQDVNWNVPQNKLGIDGSSFYTSLTLALGASWACLLCWVVLTIMAAIQIARRGLTRTISKENLPAQEGGSNPGTA